LINDCLAISETGTKSEKIQTNRQWTICSHTDPYTVYVRSLYHYHLNVTQWFPNFFSSRTICGNHTVTTYYLALGKLNLPNIMRSKVWKTRIDTFARAAVPEPGGPELGILPDAGARTKNQEL